MIDKLLDMICEKKYILHIDQMMCAVALLEAMHVIRWAIIEYLETGEEPWICHDERFTQHHGICQNIKAYMLSKQRDLIVTSIKQASHYAFDFFNPSVSYAVMLAVFNKQPSRSNSLIFPIKTDEYPDGKHYYNSTVDKYQDGVRLYWINSCISDLEHIIEVGEFTFPRSASTSKLVKKSMELHRHG